MKNETFSSDMIVPPPHLTKKGLGIMTIYMLHIDLISLKNKYVDYIYISKNMSTINVKCTLYADYSSIKTYLAQKHGAFLFATQRILDIQFPTSRKC